MNPIEEELNNIEDIMASIETSVIDNNIQDEQVNIEEADDVLLEQTVNETDNYSVDNIVDEELKKLERIHQAIMGILATEDKEKSGRSR